MKQLNVIGACVALASAILLVLFGLEALDASALEGIVPIGGNPFNQFVVVNAVTIGFVGAICAIGEIRRAINKDDDETDGSDS